MNNIQSKIVIFAQKLQDETIIRLHQSNLACQANLDNAKTTILPGKKFTKVNVGNSGKYMVENETGNIFGIKGYGVVHRGHFYGTVDTINDYNWGDFYPRKIVGNPINNGRRRCPVLTFAPKPQPSTQLATALIGTSIICAC